METLAVSLNDGGADIELAATCMLLMQKALSRATTGAQRRRALAKLLGQPHNLAALARSARRHIVLPMQRIVCNTMFALMRAWFEVPGCRGEWDSAEAKEPDSVAATKSVIEFAAEVVRSEDVELASDGFS